MSKIVITKQQAIEDLLERANDWDVDTLLGYVNNHYRKYLESLKIRDLEKNYATEFDIVDAEDKVKIVNTKMSKVLFNKKV
jgi:hypothetical protein